MAGHYSSLPGTRQKYVPFPLTDGDVWKLRGTIQHTRKLYEALWFCHLGGQGLPENLKSGLR